MEQQAWWKRNRKDLPLSVTREEELHLEYLTGNVPLFLGVLVTTQPRKSAFVSNEILATESHGESEGNINLPSGFSVEFGQFVEELWQCKQVQLLGGRIAQYAADRTKELVGAGRTRM